MGCDIHVHAEVKIGGKWHHYAMPEFSRNYAMFERMAGVRGDVSNAIAAPRGMPRNATFITKFDCKRWGIDGHSHSWLSADEILALAKWYEREYPDNHYAEWDCYLFGNCYSTFRKYPDDCPKELQDVRFIFWFDN